MSAHPRGGGENVVAAISAAGVAGSSPRGRGKPFDLRYPPATPRLIPAGAGKTERAQKLRLTHWAHPRGGGENTF